MSDMIDYGVVLDINEVCNMIMEFSSSTVMKIGEAFAFVGGLPAAIEDFLRENGALRHILRRCSICNHGAQGLVTWYG
jgi:hypothetical protein